MSQQNICRYFAASGNCFYGDQCNFAHVRPEQSGQTTTIDIASKPKSQVTCRNIALHGFCKFQGKGCEYNHGEQTTLPSKKPEEQQQQQQVPLILKRPTTDVIPNFQNLTISGPQRPKDQEPEIQRPHSGMEVPNHPNGAIPNPNMWIPTPHSAPPTPVIHHGNEMMGNPYMRYDPSQMMHGPRHSLPMQPQQKPINPNINAPPQFAQPHTPQPSSAPIHVRGGTTYFYGPAIEPEPQAPPVQLQLNPTASTLPHTAKIGRRTMASFFMPEDLRQEMIRKSLLTYAMLPPEDPRTKDIPNVVYRYHSLFPLDNPTRPPNTNTFGYVTSVYKAISSVDGLPYTIRKVESFRLSNEQALRMGDRWKQIQSPNIVGLADVFISKDFGEVNALFFAYNFHPGSETLEEKYFVQMSDFIPEPILWSYIIQLANALRVVHNAGLACRGIIHPSKVLLTGKNRVRLNCVGINDVVNFDGGKNLQHFQHDDLLSFGKLILVLACKSMNAVQNLVKSVEYLASRYSSDMKNLVVYLLSKPTSMNHPTIDEVMSMISGRIVNELDNLYNYADLVESDLSKEVENGRLCRMLMKLGFVNERPEYDMDPAWSETGDRYLLKLFRDYVFHQVYEDNTPLIDYGHVVECLNKLDAGVPEKIVLMSRDEQSLLIVSYKDLKRCIEEAYGELMHRTAHLRRQEYM